MDPAWCSWFQILISGFIPEIEFSHMAAKPFLPFDGLTSKVNEFSLRNETITSLIAYLYNAFEFIDKW